MKDFLTRLLLHIRSSMVSQESYDYMPFYIVEYHSVCAPIRRH